MRGRRRLTLGAVVAASLVATIGVLIPHAAQAHGAMQIPGSRTWLCYEDGLTASGQIIPNNPACAAAVAQSGVNSLYNWFAVARRDGATSGMTKGLIPDGKQCSAQSNYYDFSGFDIVSQDWPKTHLTSGSTIQIRYNKWAAHPGTWYLYITKPTWDPTKPLTWDEFNLVPFSQATDPPSVGNPGSVDSYYYWNATLPSGYSGYQIIYSVWARSDSTETFYGCSDVMFDGGNGNVTGIGPGGSAGNTGTPTAGSTSNDVPRSPSASASRSASSSPSASSIGGTGCTATYQVTSTWGGGFQAAVTVANKSSSPINGWTVNWTFTSGESISQVWNATQTTSGSTVTAKNVSWNGSVGANATASFGFLGSGVPASSVSGITCTSS